jgi:D-psicose/D-tagatose/L-ribulose 3-epimerase
MIAIVNRLGINFWNWIDAFSEKDLYLFKKAAQLGFDACEIGMVNPNFDYRSVKRSADEFQMELTLCGAFLKGRDLSNFDSQIRQNTEKYFVDCFRAAEALGAKVFAGPVYAGGGKAHLLNSDDQKREWTLAVEGLAKMARIAGDYGVRIALEPINRYRTSLINTVEQALTMVAEIGSPNLGVLFDTYQAGIEEENVAVALKLVCEAGKLVHFHACGTNRGAPGSGHLPWRDLADILKRYNYTGHITIESFLKGGMDGAWRELEPTQDR